MYTKFGTPGCQHSFVYLDFSLENSQRGPTILQTADYVTVLRVRMVTNTKKSPSHLDEHKELNTRIGAIQRTLTLVCGSMGEINNTLKETLLGKRALVGVNIKGGENMDHMKFTST